MISFQIIDDKDGGVYLNYYSKKLTLGKGLS